MFFCAEAYEQARGLSTWRRVRRQTQQGAPSKIVGRLPTSALPL